MENPGQMQHQLNRFVRQGVLVVESGSGAERRYTVAARGDSQL